ncbi:MAG: FprA family A-type flavoprotein [Ruminococcaceae bacterium]|nr:FprA family A-type flavoprotein [Oscillospiraceae bacterium]
MKIKDNIYYVGVNDKEIDLFEGQYIVPNGMAYNSYVLMDDKIAVMDSVDGRFGNAWIENIKNTLGDKTPDYIIVQHMEPDHSSSLMLFAKTYKNATFVASSKAFTMMKNFYGNDFADRRIVVKDGDTLNLGSLTLNFVAAPMVHWPEVMMTYESATKTLFSADGFGKFGALDADEDWACEARRYYFGIVGKYGIQVQMVLKRVADIEIETICPLHGPILSENLGYYLDLYNTWSSYGTESEGVVIAYTSVYGNTKKAVELLAEELKLNGHEKVVVNDLARSDMAECVEDAFRYGKIVLATTTYNNDIFPFMKEFINHLTERNFQNKKIGIIENGTWGPNASRVMKGMLENCKNLTFCENEVKILSAVNEENINAIKALAKEL